MNEKLVGGKLEEQNVLAIFLNDICAFSGSVTRCAFRNQSIRGSFCE